MNREQAQEILLLYRPGTDNPAEPEIAQALALAREDHELGEWLRRHQAFQSTMRASLRAIPVPSGLRDQLWRENKIIRPPAWWQKPSPLWLAAAAVLIVLLGVAPLWVGQTRPDRFVHFQRRMVGEVLRQYGMDQKTSDLNQLRQFIATRGAPADFRVPPGLEKLSLTGGGVLRWRSHPVSMVCFDRGDQQMVFLFVMKRSAVKDPPPDKPASEKVSELWTTSWSEGEHAYVLAGFEEPDFQKKYL